MMSRGNATPGKGKRPMTAAGDYTAGAPTPKKSKSTRPTQDPNDPGRVFVAVRIRPLSGKEQEENQLEQFYAEGGNRCVAVRPAWLPTEAAAHAWEAGPHAVSSPYPDGQLPLYCRAVFISSKAFP